MQLLWITSAALTALSILLMTALLISRLLAQYKGKGRAEDRHIARGAFIAFASDTNEDQLFNALRDIDTELVSESASELLNLIRGDIAPHLRAVLERLDVPSYERRLLKHGLLPTRLRAAEFLAFFPDAATIAALRAALSDRSYEIRITAAISLADMRVEFDLRAFLIGMQKAHVSNKRISELLEIVFRTDRDRVIALLREDTLDDGFKSLLVEGICRTKSPDLAGLLAELISVPRSSEFAATIIRSSAVLGHAQSLAMIVEYLNSPDPELKLAAADGARLLGLPDDRVVAALGQMMESSEWTLRHAALTALQSFGTTGREELTRFRSKARMRTGTTDGPHVLETGYV